MEPVEFKCKITKNHIEYRCNPDPNKDGDIYMEYCYIDQEKPKPFFVLLRTSINSLTKKGYTKLVQRVTMDDWIVLKNNTKWQMRATETFNGLVTVVIECNINDAINCISNGLGITS